MKQFFAVVFCTFLVGCTTPGKKTGIGAGVGAAAGAGLGAIIGNQSGNAGGGALIGAAAGGLLGGAIGNHMDKQAQELAKVAETKRTEQGILTKLKGDILFETGSATIKPEAENNIQKMADIIKKYPEDRISIVGHTDSTGKIETNKILSEQRAMAVKTILITRGVPADTVNAVGMGSSQPVANNKTSAGRAQNRRVELHITAKEESAQN